MYKKSQRITNGADDQEVVPPQHGRDGATWRTSVIASLLLIFGPSILADINVIPHPCTCDIKQETLSTDTAKKLVNNNFTGSGIVLDLVSDKQSKAELGDEGYRLQVQPDKVIIQATTEAGLFYGKQTLHQMLPDVPCCTITDKPRFKWRGLLVDPARHFIPVEDILKFIDVMGLYKFNKLQMHLTDNQGWRIEIKKYPGLTEIGSKRDYSGGKGGFYTQDDIRRMVKYAQERHITIIPEIEMPAHSGAAIDSYPEILGFKPDPSPRLMCPRPAAVAFMQNILAEISELFPSEYIHIGGDEAKMRFWRDNAEVQGLINGLNMKDVHELHGWFIKQMDTFLAQHGRKLIGWDDMIKGGLAQNATVMSWRGMQGGITAAQSGHDVIMAPRQFVYFDYAQASSGEPRAIGDRKWFLPLEKVYSFEPIPNGLTPKETSHILGGQGQLWGEFISTHSHREYMAFPRALALAEVLWSPADSRSYDDFLKRLPTALKQLSAMGVNYRDPKKEKEE